MKTAEIETVYQIIETAIKSEPYPETARCAAVKAEHVLKALEERGYQIQFKLPPVSLEKKQEIIDCLNTAILDEMEDDDFVEYFNREIIPIIVPALIKRFSFGDWIDVKDNLPTEGERVLAVYNDGFNLIVNRKAMYIFIDSFDKSKHWEENGGTRHFDYKVTHWMPLPTPPKK